MAITVKSDQLTKIESVPPQQNPSRDEDARLRCKVFTYTTTGDEGAAPTTIRLGTLKKGWRLLGMRAVSPVMGGTSATLSLGITGSTARYMGLTAIQAAALSADGNHTAGLFHGEVLAADIELLATTAVEALLANKVLTVVVYYTRD